MIKYTGTKWQKVKKARMCYLMVLPFLLLFAVFIVIPVIVAFVFSFTDFNMLEFPNFVGLDNYFRMFLEDDNYITAVRNTLVFAVITGPLSYFACLIFAWLINELSPVPRSILTVIFYLPSMSNMIFVIWTYIFSGDQYGVLNTVLMQLNIIKEPIQWLTDADTIMPVIIFVQLWLSLGTSFLSFIAGLQNVNTELYEAAAVDGVKNRWQEVIYVTLPSMGPQLLFGAVMQISAAFSIGSICVTLAGFPSTDNAALTIITHITDYGTTRMELGYACAMSFVLFVIVFITNNVIQSIIRKHTDI